MPLPRLLLTISLSLAFALPAAAGAASKADTEWANAPRTVRVTANDHGFDFQSDGVGTEAADSFRGDYEARESRFRIRFAGGPEGGSVPPELRLYFLEWLEFSDENADGRPDPTEPVAQRLAFSRLGSPVVSVSGSGDAPQVATVSYPLPSSPSGAPAGVTREVILRFAFAGRTFADAALPQRPTSIPLTIEAKAFPYRWTNTTLALVIAVATPQELRTTAHSVRAESSNLALFYDWSGDDPTSAPVSIVQPGQTVSGPAGRADADLLFAFQRFEVATQTHTIGAERIQGERSFPDLFRVPEGNGLLFAVGAIATMGLIAWTATARLRSRRKGSAKNR